MNEKKYQAEYYLRNRERLLRNNKANFKKSSTTQTTRFVYKLKKLYGISYEEYLTLLETQNQSCAICKKQLKLGVDHCHKTGKVRGLLCRTCNLLLGHCEDDPGILEEAIKYLTN